jgi:hypothetical protein
VGEVRFVLPGGVGMRGAWMRSGGVDVWRRGLLICVCDNSMVVGWLCPCHPVSGGLRLWAVSGLVFAVFAVEQAVKSARIFLTARGLAIGVLVGDVVHLLLIAAVPIGVWLRRPRPRAAGLWSVFGFPLRLEFALVELFGSSIFFK